MFRAARNLAAEAASNLWCRSIGKSTILTRWQTARSLRRQPNPAPANFRIVVEHIRAIAQSKLPWDTHRGKPLSAANTKPDRRIRVRYNQIAVGEARLSQFGSMLARHLPYMRPCSATERTEHLQRERPFNGPLTRAARGHSVADTQLLSAVLVTWQA